MRQRWENRAGASTRQRVNNPIRGSRVCGGASTRQRVNSVFTCFRAPNHSLATGNHNAKPQPGHWNASNRKSASTRQRVNAATRQRSDLRPPAVRCASTRQRVKIRFQLFQSTKPQPGHWKPQCQTTAWPLECPKSELRVNASTRQRVNASTRPFRVPDSPCSRTTTCAPAVPQPTPE